MWKLRKINEKFIVVAIVLTALIVIFKSLTER